ncbi:adenosylcobinamide-GDP ribazoletransferase, partial [Bradyrhizobium ottawaense]
GALHEDGLADTADGLGGGRTRERKLEIMRDSRIGTYGVCALILSFGLRWSALAAIADPLLVAFALCAAHAAARAGVPAFMSLVPPARPDGLSASAGSPPGRSVAIAFALGTLALALALGPGKALVGLIL